MWLGTIATTLILMLDEIALMVDRLAIPARVPAEEIGGAPGEQTAPQHRRASGSNLDRELRLVWRVAKASARSKAILVPAALMISAFAPWAILPLLVIGGAYLCYEGADKIVPRAWPGTQGKPPVGIGAAGWAGSAEEQATAAERATIKAALVTDFILSAEIIVVALGGVVDATLLTQFVALGTVAVVATVGVYGSVAAILRLDNAGRYLMGVKGQHALVRLQRRLGAWLANAAPSVTRTLAVIGTAAAFLIGGELVALGIPGVPDGIDHLASQFGEVPAIGGAVGWAVGALLETAIGVFCGVMMMTTVVAVRRAWRAAASGTSP